MKSILLLDLVALLSIVFTGCAAAKPECTYDGVVAPKSVCEFNKKNLDKLTAIGSSDISGVGMSYSKKIASSIARANLSRKISTMSSQKRLTTRTISSWTDKKEDKVYVFISE